MTGVVALDQALKAILVRTLPLGASVALLPVLSLTHVHNPGVAFSLLPQVPAFVPAAIVLALLVLLFRREGRGKTHDTQVQRALALLAGGAMGNLIDRVRLGAVIDYLDLRVWPVFNLADVAVTTGAALLILALVARPEATPLTRGDR